VVDPRGLPVKNARELRTDDKKLVFMYVAVHENTRQLRGHLHLLAPPLASIGASEAIGCLRDGLPSGTRVKGTVKPAIIRAIVMGRRPGAGYLRWCNFVAPRDGTAKLV
jgi:hypothetical protein